MTTAVSTYENVTPTAPRIESEDYGIEANALSTEPVILAMAANLVFTAKNQNKTVEELMNEDSYGFMVAAREQAHKYGVTGSYIGAVVRAITLALNRMAENDADMNNAADKILSEDSVREVEVNAVVGKVKRARNSYFWAFEQSKIVGDSFKGFDPSVLEGTDNVLVVLKHAQRFGFPDAHVQDTTALVKAYQKRLVEVQRELF